MFALLKTAVAFSLHHSRLMIELAVMVLIALIWVIGPSVGLESVDLRVLLMGGVAVLRLLWYVVGLAMTRRRADRLEASLGHQAQQQLASSRPDRAEELAAIRAQFDKGVAALKESKLGRGLKGRMALYALPWYMFIGPPGSGKSTALRHSGLQFPYLGGSGQGLQGLGGTRNCDWWFTNEAVLLDTAGRYVSHEEDQEEWLGFLQLLKKYRKGQAINGVLAAISVADLVQAADEQIEAHARQIRNRIGELIQQLGMVFPVYVIFTKCDLLQGFVEFFEDLNRSERERLWGSTLPRALREDPAMRFQQEFDALMEVIEGRRLTRLATVRRLHKATVLSFPLQLAACRERLGRFVATLFQPNPYQESPIFRGFYFTSGTQEGTPIDRILGAVARDSGVAAPLAASLVATEPKSYFLKDLFTATIFPDQRLATLSSTVHRQRGYLRIAASIAAGVFVMLSVTALGISFVGNKQLLADLQSAAEGISETTTFDVESFEKTLELMDRLGERYAQVKDYEENGEPLRLWGLYYGGSVYGPLRDLYAKYFLRIFLLPLKREMEETFTQVANDPAAALKEETSGYYYALVKAYLMLGEPHHLNAQFLSEALATLWKSRLRSLYVVQPVPVWVSDGVAAQMELYSVHLAKDEGTRLALNRRLVHEVQRKLRQVPLPERVYALVQRDLSDSLKPVSLQSIVQSPQSPLISDYTIPGLFVYDTGRPAFRRALGKVLSNVGQESWVLGEPEPQSGELEQAVQALYLHDYTFHWRSFIKSLRIRPSPTPADTDNVLTALTQPDSPLLAVFQVIERNTRSEPELLGAAIPPAITGLVEKVKKGLGLEGDQARLNGLLGEATTGEFTRVVAPRFKSVQALVVVPKDAKEEPPLARYVAELRKVHETIRAALRADTPTADTRTMARSIVAGESNALVQGFRDTEALLQAMDAETHEAMVPLLIEPWVMAMRGLVDRTYGDVARRWENDITPPCQRNIEPHYPFRASGGDATLADVTEFFHPETGTLWQFYQADLKPFVAEGPQQWNPKTWNGVGMALSPEFLEGLRYARIISESLFPKGSADLAVAFDLYPYPPQGPLSRDVTEIRLDVGGQTLRYRMEPQEWHEMKWPGPTGAAGATLQAQVGTTWIMKEYKNLWGWFRLLGEGKPLIGPEETQSRLEWDLMTSEGRSIRVQYDLRARNDKNPFRPGLFKQFRCPHPTVAS